MSQPIPDGGELSHEDVWDDSALIKSWNEALEEYKKYHSIHLEGGTANTVKRKLDALENAKPITNRQTGNTAGTAGRIKLAYESPEPVRSTEFSDQVVAAAQPASRGANAGGAGMASLGPQTLLASVQDEGLKKLLMSWYYAGYYTVFTVNFQEHASANNVYPARRNAVVDPGRRRRPDGFSFLSQNHTATQSAFAEPWKAITGGMNSGFQPKPNNSITPPPQVAMQAMASTPLCITTIPCRSLRTLVSKSLEPVKSLLQLPSTPPRYRPD
ncbi:hypothetical protein P8C59_004323 [Phyllachora maydis]|uniref:Survival Motor Neuron Gemin2-binding domain-containing protein n=1 Tax=Phyllachora maydis TaxID=1825666 RepID=A0AAD9I246_9PEZI|nr:hypothetical protein P8C59_004323 [Phyllachora maydis]